MKIQIYTEVAMESNPGSGTWSFVAYDGRTRLFGNFHNFEYETSNRAKLLAVLGAIEALEKRCEDISNYTINTNFKVLADAIQFKWIENWSKNNWKNKQGVPIENKDLWEKILEKISNGLDVVWVKKNAFRYKLPRKVSKEINFQSNPSRTKKERQ